jgi:hypothetical protein
MATNEKIIPMPTNKLTPHGNTQKHQLHHRRRRKGQLGRNNKKVLMETKRNISHYKINIFAKHLHANKNKIPTATQK